MPAPQAPAVNNIDPRRIAYEIANQLVYLASTMDAAPPTLPSYNNFDERMAGAIILQALESIGNNLVANVQQTVLAGQNEAVDDTYDIAAMEAGDEVISVLIFTAGVPSEGTGYVAGNGILTSTSPQDLTGETLVVTWIDRTP